MLLCDSHLFSVQASCVYLALHFSFLLSYPYISHGRYGCCIKTEGDSHTEPWVKVSIVAFKSQEVNGFLGCMSINLALMVYFLFLDPFFPFCINIQAAVGILPLLGFSLKVSGRREKDGGEKEKKKIKLFWKSELC